MTKIIYNLTGNFRCAFGMDDLKLLSKCYLFAEDLDSECYNNIKSEIQHRIATIRAAYPSILDELDSILHINYPNLISYEVCYDNEMIPTGEVILCLE